MGTLELQAGELRLTWQVTADVVHEQISVRRGDTWVEMARSDPSRPGLQSLIFGVVEDPIGGSSGRAVTQGQPAEWPVRPVQWDVQPDRVVLQARAEEVPIQITWRAIDGRIHLDVHARFHWAVHLETLRSRYLYAPEGALCGDRAAGSGLHAEPSPTAG